MQINLEGELQIIHKRAFINEPSQRKPKSAAINKPGTGNARMNFTIY